ncbi:hypothetical protein HYPSUDRAFT_1096147, partial [Hypholoma sublateritium FD-334 SS-4]
FFSIQCRPNALYDVRNITAIADAHASPLRHAHPDSRRRSPLCVSTAPSINKCPGKICSDAPCPEPPPDITVSRNASHSSN